MSFPLKQFSFILKYTSNSDADKMFQFCLFVFQNFLFLMLSFYTSLSHCLIFNKLYCLKNLQDLDDFIYNPVGSLKNKQTKKVKTFNQS